MWIDENAQVIFKASLRRGKEFSCGAQDTGWAWSVGAGSVIRGGLSCWDDPSSEIVWRGG